MSTSYYISNEKAHELWDFIKSNKYFYNFSPDQFGNEIIQKARIRNFSIQIWIRANPSFPSKFHIVHFEEYGRKIVSKVISLEDFVNGLSKEAKKEVIFNLDLFKP